MAGARRLATEHPGEASAAVIVEGAPQGQWRLLCSQNNQRGASADAGPRGRRYKRGASSRAPLKRSTLIPRHGCQLDHEGSAGHSVQAPEVGPVQALGRCDPVLPSLQTAALFLGFGAQFSLFPFSQRRTSGSGLWQWKQMGPPDASREAPPVFLFDPKSSQCAQKGEGGGRLREEPRAAAGGMAAPTKLCFCPSIWAPPLTFGWGVEEQKNLDYLRACY